MRLAEYFEATKDTQPAFALRVGVTQSAVSQWVGGGQIRAEKVLAVAAATGWRVTPHELRSDLYPHPVDGMPKQKSGRVLRMAAGA